MASSQERCPERQADRNVSRAASQLCPLLSLAACVGWEGAGVRGAGCEGA